MLTTLVTLPLWFVVLTQFPAVAWVFVGLGLVCAVGLLLAGLSASVHGVAHEACAMWRPLFGWLPRPLRDAPLVRWGLALGALVMLNVSLHWLLRP